MRIILLLCLFATSALGQRFNEPIRMINNRRVDLTPLLTWWTNAMAINQANETRAETNQIAVPPRPLTAWSLIFTDRMTNAGLVWICEIQILQRPDDTPVREVAVLEHVPLAGKQAFDRAAARDANAEKELTAAESAKEVHEKRAEQYGQRANTFFEFDYMAPGHGFFDEGVRLSYAAQGEKKRAETAEQRSSNLRVEREKLSAITEGRTQFALEAFALKTTRKHLGLPVYDVGLPFGR
ncbi:MAG TPA: hypothetical protein VFZ59_02775 [Verrucomicrobiae bacterium]|nr:hypothetical protein [Verrucomicrobiae bacterium]